MSNQSENQTSAKLKQNLDIEDTVLMVKSSTDNIFRPLYLEPFQIICLNTPLIHTSLMYLKWNMDERLGLKFHLSYTYIPQRFFLNKVIFVTEFVI
jgi:hypothetical protein